MHSGILAKVLPTQKVSRIQINIIINVETSESMENKTPHTTKSQRYETMLITDTRIGHKVVLVLIVDPY